MKRVAPFSMRLDEELKAELQKLANAENRSLTNFVETALWQLVSTRRQPRAEQSAKRK